MFVYLKYYIIKFLNVDRCFFLYTAVFYLCWNVCNALCLIELAQNLQNDVRPAKTQISLGIHPVWSESSLSAWRKPWSLATHRVDCEDSGQTRQMPKLIWVFAGRTFHYVGFVERWLIYVLVFISAGCIILGIIIYGAKVEDNLSWSFILCTIAGIIFGICGLLLVIDMLKR